MGKFRKLLICVMVGTILSGLNTANETVFNPTVILSADEVSEDEEVDYSNPFADEASEASDYDDEYGDSSDSYLYDEDDYEPEDDLDDQKQNPDTSDLNVLFPPLMIFFTGLLVLLKLRKKNLVR